MSFNLLPPKQEKPMAKSLGVFFGSNHKLNEEEFNKFEEPNVNFVSEPVRPEFDVITKLLAQRMRAHTEDVNLKVAEEEIHNKAMGEMEKEFQRKISATGRRPRF